MGEYYKAAAIMFISFHLLVVACHCHAANEERQVYIVYMGSLPRDENAVYTPHSHHIELLQQVVEGSSAEETLVHSYGRSFNGFAAKLTQTEKQKLSEMKGVVSVFLSKKLKLQTTRSWDFIGFPLNPTPIQKPHSPSPSTDIIIGILDSGIWPENPSFNDEGFPPIPTKWKGTCRESGPTFPCNKKLIGARHYLPSSTDARDTNGHGTHTTSTAAGRIIPNTSFHGLANGAARGGAPFARIAVYRVCDEECYEAGVLAAFDDAIADGVDLISISIGSATARPVDEDVIGIGSLHGVEKGVLTSHAAGNSGPMIETTSSVVPWVLSVGASSIDRRIVDKVVLGNGESFVGACINPFDNKEKVALVKGCNDSELMKGKISVCEIGETSLDQLMGTAVGVVTELSHNPDFSSIVPLPTVELSSDDYNTVSQYVDSTKNPIASIMKSESINATTAPMVVSFSSRGPNPTWHNIFKPDITAPGVEILAGYYPNAFNKPVNYSILSGTSMSCPHGTGAAAYVKSLNPNLSPSAIKSALMTTAKPMSPIHNKEAEFAYGSGQLNPIKAANPGLVYETLNSDYINLLCFSGLGTDKVRTITGDKTVICPTHQNFNPKDVNYPAIALKVEETGEFSVSVNRTVTNVGPVKSKYMVKVKSMNNKDIVIEVEPKRLEFSTVNEKKSFVVKVSSKVGWKSSSKMFSGEILWDDGVHEVRSPIVVYHVLANKLG